MNKNFHICLLWILTPAILFIFAFEISETLAFQVSASESGAPIHWASSGCGFRMNVLNGPEGSLDALKKALETWNKAPSHPFNFFYAGESISTAHGDNDGINLIDFGALSPGVLAQNSFWFFCDTGNLIDSDIRFNTAYAWDISGSSASYDVQNIGTHELGHSLSLADLYDSSDSKKTMYGYSFPGETQKRTLCSDDMAGIQYIYPNGDSLYFEDQVITSGTYWSDSIIATKITIPSGAVVTFEASESILANNFTVEGGAYVTFDAPFIIADNNFLVRSEATLIFEASEITIGPHFTIEKDSTVLLTADNVTIFPELTAQKGCKFEINIY